MRRLPVKKYFDRILCNTREHNILETGRHTCIYSYIYMYMYIAKYLHLSIYLYLYKIYITSRRRERQSGSSDDTLIVVFIVSEILICLLSHVFN